MNGVETRIADVKFLALDVETTGLEPLKGDEVVQLGACRIRDGKVLFPWSSLVQPKRAEIDVRAMAVHHITPRMLADKPSLEEAWSAEFASRAAITDCYAAHNAAFDAAFLRNLTGEVPWLCTLRLARHLWPEAPSHQLQVLRYWLPLPCPGEWILDGRQAHSGDVDAWLCGQLLLREIKEIERCAPEIQTLEQLIAFAQQPTPNELAEQEVAS